MLLFLVLLVLERKLSLEEEKNIFALEIRIQCPRSRRMET